MRQSVVALSVAFLVGAPALATPDPAEAPQRGTAEASAPATGAASEGGDESAVEPSRTQAYLHFLKARERERVGDVDGAIREYAEVLEADPDSVSVRVALAGLLADAHRAAEAMDTLREALRFAPKDVSARRLLAMILLRLRAEPRGDEYDRDVRIAFEELVVLAPEDVEARRTLGKLALEQGDSEAAEGQFEKIIELDPSDLEARLLLARALFQKREFDRAADLYEGLERDMGELPDREKAGQVLCYLFAERFTHAIAVADLGIKHTGEDSPEHLKFLKLKGFAASGMGDQALAVTTFERVLALDPGDRETRFRLAQALERRRDLERAASEYEKVRAEIEAAPQGPEMDPPYVQVLYRIGSIQLELEQATEAVASLQLALSKVEAEDRFRPALVEKLARALHRSGQQQEAFELLESIIDARPDLPDFQIELAELFLGSGRDREAGKLVKSYLRGFDKDKRFDACLVAADMYQRVGRYDAALDVLEDARKIEPGEETVYFLLGSVRERLGRVAEAEAAFKQAITLDPESGRALNYLGYMLADRDLKLDDSLEYIRRAIELEPHNGAYLDSLGWVYFKRGELDEALESLERAVAQLSDDPVIHDHMAQVYFGLKQYDNAVDAWQKALDFGSDEPATIRKRIEEARALRTSRRD